MNTISMVAAALLMVSSGSPQVRQYGARADEGPWPVSRDGPDTVWTLVEASVGTDDTARRAALLVEAERQARAALAGHEEDPEAHHALAVALGARANTEGGQDRVRTAAALKDELDAILALDPGHAGAHHLLGRLHAGVRRTSGLTRWVATNLMGGAALKQATWESAEENLAFAETHAPEVLDHHLQLALLYRDTGRPQLAAEEIDHVMRLQAVNALDMAVLAEAMDVRAKLQP